MTIEEMKALARAKATEAHDISKAAADAGRGFTEDERKQVTGLLDEANDLRVRINRAMDAAGDAEIRAEIDTIGRTFGGSGFASVTRRGSSAFGDAARRAGLKELPSGGFTAPAVTPAIAPLEDRPATFLSAIGRLPVEGTDSFTYYREVIRELNAQAVPAGALKPTSDVELEKVDDTVRTIATLSTPVHRRLLADASEVGQFLDGVLFDAVVRELERLVVEGDSGIAGLDEFDGLKTLSGTSSQEFATDILTTTRKALTALQVLRLTGPFLFLMSPAQWEEFELLKSDESFVLGDAGGTGQRLPVDRARQALWGTSVAITDVLDDGEAILGDFSPSSIRVRERELSNITWSEGTLMPIEGDTSSATATGFETNRIVFRCESRVGIEIRRPHAFSLVDLTA
ncbi:MAG: phage major capsid protein [Acidimicrobiia bacterium]